MAVDTTVKQDLKRDLKRPLAGLGGGGGGLDYGVALAGLSYDSLTVSLSDASAYGLTGSAFDIENADPGILVSHRLTQATRTITLSDVNDVSTGVLTSGPVATYYDFDAVPGGGEIFGMDTVGNVFKLTTSAPYSVVGETWVSESFSFGDLFPETGAFYRSFKFNQDGTKVWATSSTSNIYEADLGTPWVLSTAVYDSVSFSYGGITGPAGFTLAPDGKYMAVGGNGNDVVLVIELSASNSLASASTLASHNLNTLSAGACQGPNGLLMNVHEKKLYVASSDDGDIHQFSWTG